MASLDFGSHPISVVRELNYRYGSDLVFEFSRYHYRPRSLLDERETFKVASAQISPSWLTDQIYRLNPEQELAMHSRVWFGGALTHIRMIDFDGISIEHMTGLGKVLTREESDSMRYFFSGRSFHAYSLILVHSEGEWIDFMARLLLSNLPSKVKVVDARWVGHRLLARYASLRWSAQTARHLQYPEALDPSLLKDPHIMARLQRVRRESTRLARDLEKKRQLPLG